jgi:hypothetical protein
LVGGESADTQLVGVLNAILTVPVDAGQPLYNVDCRGAQVVNSGRSMGQWATALGLALRRTKGSFRPRDGKPREPLGQRMESLPLEKLNTAENAEAGPGDRDAAAGAAVANGANAEHNRPTNRPAPPAARQEVTHAGA